MPRPPDWSALDLGSDPTPGDADRLEALIEAQRAIVELATELDDDLEELMRENSEFFVGETAGALREEMDDRVRKFVRSFAEAHESVRTALTTYHETMVTQQGIADGALSAVDGMDEDDAEFAGHKETAENAGDALEAAAATAASAIQEAGSNISSMIDPCEAFWKFLQFFVIALILPAIILGGPTAILFLTLSAVLLVKTAIDFAGGRASVTELVLSVLGMLVPTTRGLNVAGITRAITNFGSKGWAGAGGSFRQLMINVGKGSWGSFRGAGNIIASTHRHLRIGGAWSNSPMALKMTWVKDFGTYIAAHFTRYGWTAIFLPVNVGEIGVKSFSGLASAFKISLWNRGVLGQYRAGAVVHGTNVIDVRALHGFDNMGRPQVNSALWARYQPGASNVAKYLSAPPQHAWSNVSNAPIITIGGGFTPNSGFGSVADLTPAPSTPANGSTVSLLGPGGRSPIPSPNSSMADLSLPTPTLPGGLNRPGGAMTDLPTPQSGQSGSLADMRPVQPISVSFADQGRGLAPPSPVVGNTTADGIGNMAGDFYVAGTPTVVTHMPSPSGQIVGVQTPMPSSMPTPTAIATPTATPTPAGASVTSTTPVVTATPTPTTTPAPTAATTTVVSAGATPTSMPNGSTVPVGSIVPNGSVGAGGNGAIDVSQGSFSPIRFQDGVDGARIASAGGSFGQLPVVNVAGMQQLGDMSPLPTAGVTSARGDMSGITAAHHGGGNAPGALSGSQPVSFVAGQSGVPGGGGRGTAGDGAQELNLGSVSPIPLHFADQGRGLGTPDIAQAGAGARQFTDTHLGPVDAPANPGARHAAPEGNPGALTDDVAAVVPTVRPLQAAPGGQLGDVPGQAGGSAVGRPGGAPLPQATGDLAAPTQPLTPPVTAAATGGSGAAPAIRQAGGGITTPVDGIRPVNLSAVGTRAAAPVESVPTAPPRSGDGGGAGVEGGPLRRPAGQAEPGSGVVAVDSIVPPARSATPSVTPPPAALSQGLLPGGPPPATARGTGGGPAGLPPGAGAHSHPAGPLAGHTVVTPPGSTPWLVGPGGARVAGDVTRIDGLGWSFTAPGQRVGAVVDSSGQRTHDVVPLTGRGDQTTGEFAAVPLGGDRTPILFGRQGETSPAPVAFLGDSFAVQRAGGTVHFHGLDGTLLGTSHRLPGQGGHELIIDPGALRAYVAGGDGQPLAGAQVRRIGGEGLLVERPGRPTLLVDADGVRTHDVIRLPEQGGHRWTLAIPSEGHRGGPVLIRGVDEVVPAGPGGSVNPLGQHGNLVRIGGGAPLLVDDAGRVAPAVTLKNRNGDATDLVFAPAAGRTEAPAVYRSDGRLFSDEVTTGFDGNRIVVQSAATYTVHGPDGALLGSGAARTGGPLGAGNRLALPEPGGHPRILGPDGAPVPGAAVVPWDGDAFLVRVPGQRPGVVDASGVHTHDAIRLGTGNGAPHGFVTVPLRDGGTPTVHGPDGRPMPQVTAGVDGSSLTIRPAGGSTTTLYDLTGGFNGLRHQLVGGHEMVLSAGAAPRVVDAAGQPVPGSSVARVGDGAGHLVRVPGHDPVVIDAASGARTHDVVELPGQPGAAADEFVLIPGGGTGPALVVHADGRLVDGSLATPLSTGEHLVKTGDTTRLIGADGSVGHTVRTLTGQEGHPDLLVLVRSDGQVYPHPRDVDGVPLTDRRVEYRESTPQPTRADPHPATERRFSVYTADNRGAHFSADTGRFTGEGPGGAGMHRVGADEYRLLGPEDQAAVRRQLIESSSRPTVTPPGLDDTDRIVFMMPTTRIDPPVHGRPAVDPAGAHPHGGLPLGRADGDGPQDFLVTPEAGGPPMLRGPAGEVRGEAPTVEGNTVTVVRGNITHRYDATTGDWRLRTHQFDAGPWANHEVRVPNTALDADARPALVDRATGQPVPGTTVDELGDQSFRVTHDTHGGGVVVDRAGAELGTSQRLRDFQGQVTDDYVLVPARGADPGAAATPPPPVLQTRGGDVIDGARVIPTGDGHRVTRVGTPETVAVHGPGGRLQHLDHGIRGGTALDGNRLIVPPGGNARVVDGTGRPVPGTDVVATRPDGHLITTGDELIGLGRTGGAADVPLPLGGRHAEGPDLTLYTGTGGAGPRVVERQPGGQVQIAGAGEITFAGREIQIVRGTSTAVHDAAGGALLRDVHRLAGTPEFDAADLVVPGPGAGAPRLERAGAEVPGSQVRELPGGGYLVRADGTQRVLDQHARPHPGALDVTLPDGTAGIAVRSQQADGRHLFIDSHGRLDGHHNPRFDTADDGTGTLGVTWERGTLDYRITAGEAGPGTQLVQESYPVRGGGPARTLEIDHRGGAPVARFRAGDGTTTPAVPQRWDGYAGYRAEAGDGGAHTVVDHRGQVTHSAVPLSPRHGDPDAFVFRPAAHGPGGPVLRQPDGAGHPARFHPGRDSWEFTNDAGVTRRHGLDGRFVEETFTARGGTFNNYRLRLPADLEGATVRPPGGRREIPVTVVPQADGGMRVHHNTLHAAVNPATGAVTHEVLTLSRAGDARPPAHVFTDVADHRTLPAPRADDGTDVPNTHVHRTADDDVVLSRTDNPTTEYFDGVTGAFRFTETTLDGAGDALPGTLLRTHETVRDGQVFRAFDLLNHDRTAVGGWSVTGRQAIPTSPDPGTGVRVRNADRSETWVIDARGRVVVHIGAADAATHVRVGRVFDWEGGGPPTVTTHRVVDMVDSGGRRFFDVDPAGRPGAVRDGELNRLDGHRLTPEGANFRSTEHAAGLRDGEWKDYGIDGRLVEQRINIVNRGVRQDDHFYKVTYQHDAGGKITGGTWEHWRPNPGYRPPADGAPATVPRSVAPPPVAPLLDRGRVDVKGVNEGHITLLTNNVDGLRGFVFERRPLPGGGSLDAHAPGTVENFVNTHGGVRIGMNQRERWQQLDVNGNAAGHGIRIWGTSKKTFFDYHDGWHISRSQSGPVHHYRETPQGGYILTHRDPGNAFSFKTGEQGRWYRYDADFAPQATGERRWGAFGHGWKDRMPDPRTGELSLVGEKTGGYATHNIRNFQSFELGGDGLPKANGGWITVSPQGKETSVGRVEPDGGMFRNHRNAEQRPPNFYRWLLSPEFRNVDTGAREGLHFLLPNGFFHRNHRFTTDGNHAAFMMDSRYQTFDFQRTNAAGEIVQRGIQGISSRGWNTVTVPSGGRISGETRPLTNGNTLTVGDDVALPPGAVRHADHLPWTEGPGKLSGHRTFDTEHFVNPPAGVNKDRTKVAWQDQFRADVPPNGDWYSRAAGAEWQVARMGFKDGTILDFRPRPAERPAGAAGNGDLGFQRTVHGDHPAPAGGNRPAANAYTHSDWVLYNHHGKLLGRQDTFPGIGPGGADLQVVSRYKDSPLGAGKIAWTGSDGTSGYRKLASRNDMGHHNYFDRESYRDFVNTPTGPQLVREVRLLGDNTTVVSWKSRAGADGAPDEWRWNKVDRHGNIMSFGAPEQRIRHWFDDMRRWEDRVVDIPAGRADPPAGAYTSPGGGHTVVQELPVEVGSALRQAFNYKPLRTREYFPDPASLTGLGRTQDNLRALSWKEFEGGAVARRKTPFGDDGSFQELESMSKQWRRWVLDTETNQWKVITERSVAGYVRELPASSFTAEGAGRFAGDLRYSGRETYYIGVMNEYRGFERMYRQPRRTPWGSPVTETGESTYTPFAVRNIQHMLVEFGQEFVLDFLVTLAVLAALPGDFTWTDVAQAALSATISSSVKTSFIGAHNLAAQHTQFRLGLNWQDRGFPYRFRQDDDDWAGEWASNEFVLRWRGGTYDFIKDGFVAAPLGAFLGNLAALEVFGIKDSEGNRHDVSISEAALLAGAAAASAAFGTVVTGIAKNSLQNTVATRWYHRQGAIDFTFAPIVTKFIDKSIGILVLAPFVRDSIGVVPPSTGVQAGTPVEPPPLPDGSVVAAAMLEPPPLPEFGTDLPVLGHLSPYPPPVMPDWENTP
ncbi:hypothetical protein [Streptomyces sp. NBRC 109706]|uniref:hypothetical protein n=1 Tax=Streptomyces sp. NBRC 109706 TaxID=1550035 RepID=UPI0007811395|nr:hypothetical protein [Streptomyces sp. NBRC 109706]